MNIWQGIWRGLSDSSHSGVDGSFYRTVGIDGISKPGVLRVRQKLTKDSGSTVTELCKQRIAVSDGSTLWFSADSGKIWRRASGGTWELVHTTSPAAGEAKCLGAEEHNGVIYWATQSRLHKIPVANIGSAASWTANATINFATFTVTDDEAHPMARQNNELFIGDKTEIATVDDTGVFTAISEFHLDGPERITTLQSFEIDLLVGTKISSTVNWCRVLRWDTVSESWFAEDSVEENGVNAFIKDDNHIYIQAGQAGRIYFYDGQSLQPYTQMPGDWTSSKTAKVHSKAAAFLQGVPVFGLSNVSGNPALEGVYCLGSYSPNYSKALDLSYPISQNVLASLEIGAVLTSGSDMFVAWKEGSNYGVDKLDYTAKYGSAYIETRMLHLEQNRAGIKTVLELCAYYASLPANTAINFQLKKSADDSYSASFTTVDDAKEKAVKARATVPEIANAQVKVLFTVSTNDAPEVEAITVKP